MENEWNDYPAHTVGITEIAQAQMHVKEVAPRTPLQYNRVLSSRYGCKSGLNVRIFRSSAP